MNASGNNICHPEPSTVSRVKCLHWVVCRDMRMLTKESLVVYSSCLLPSGWAWLLITVQCESGPWLAEVLVLLEITGHAPPIAVGASCCTTQRSRAPSTSIKYVPALSVPASDISPDSPMNQHLDR